MKTNDIFTSLSAHTDIDQFKFLVYFNETIDEINLMYPVFDELSHSSGIKDKTEYPDILLPPIIDNILYLLGFGDKYKSEFTRKMKYVFCAWWRKASAKTGFIKRSES